MCIRDRSEAISLAELEEMTGLSRKTVVQGIAELEKQGHLIVERGLASDGRPATNVYRLGMKAGQSREVTVPDRDLHIL